jgi:hypothetical protein
MDSLIARELQEKSQQFFNQITENEEDKKDKDNKNLKHSERFVSTTDPDARVSRKQGKLPALNHLGIISVDTENHVICGALADFADTKDSNTTENIVGQTIENLHVTGLHVEEVLADTGYSSGESYKYLESQNITAYIPPISGYQPEKEGFIYDKNANCYICSQGKILIFKGIKKEKNRNTSSKVYRTRANDCRLCQFRLKCCKKVKYKQLSQSVDKPYYDRAYELLNTQKGKRKMRLRGSTVEPVWGTLLNFRRLRKVYTKGNDLAHKQVLMAAAAYNLKKLMGFSSIKSVANAIKNITMDLKTTVLSQILLFLESILLCCNYRTVRNMNVDIIY